MLDESGNVREGFLEPAEFEAVRAHLPDYLQDVARFAYLTCWRIGAVRALEWRDVDLRARKLQLRTTSAKNKRAKTMPLVGDVLAILTRRAEDRDPAKVAGLGGLLFHALRRSGARNAVRAGNAERVVMDLGGWKTRSVLDRYNVTSEKDLGEALARTSRYVAKRATEKPIVRQLRPVRAQNG